MSIADVILQIIKSFSNQKVKQESTLKVVVEKKPQIKLNKQILKKKLFFGSLPTFQLEPLEAISNELYRRDIKNPAIYAYIMATAYHETARFKYKEEIGKGKGRDYGAHHTLIRGKKERYYGRGFTQLTWLQNYSKMSIKCSLAFDKEIDLVSSPNKVFEDHSINSFIICEGSLEGSFTGKKLSDYITDEKTDFVNARRVINGTDASEQIAQYASTFLESLNG